MIWALFDKKRSLFYTFLQKINVFLHFLVHPSKKAHPVKNIFIFDLTVDWYVVYWDKSYGWYIQFKR